MRYISPFHYFPTESINDILVDTSKIKLVRKRLLAEVELSDTQSIFIDGKELTKFDVINLFDNLSDSAILEIHAGIYKDKALLDFLENGNFTPNLNSYYSGILANKTALDFISPYYKEASILLLVDAIQKKNLETIKYFFTSKHLLTNEDTFEIYENITKKIIVLTNPISDLEKQIENNKNDVSVEDLINLKLGTVINILNILPEDFSKTREDVAFSLNALGCDLINNSHNFYAKELFTKALHLKCSDYIIDYFQRNLKTATDNIKIAPNNGNKNNNKNLQNVIKIIALFFILNLLYGIFNDEKSTKNKTKGYTISSLNYDTPTDIEHYPTYSSVDTSFYDLMLLLDKQDNRLLSANNIPIVFKKGDNIYNTLFQDSAFSIAKSKFTVGSAPMKKLVLFCNKSVYQCILIIRNSTIISDDELITENFTSKYIPANDSLEIILEEGFNDIRPYMGLNIVENKDFKRSNLNANGIDFQPKYMFDSVPKNNLLSGIGVKFKSIADSNARIIIMQDEYGKLFQEIGYFLQ